MCVRDIAQIRQIGSHYTIFCSQTKCEHDFVPINLCLLDVKKQTMEICGKNMKYM
jgi:hypothetical protein